MLQGTAVPGPEDAIAHRHRTPVRPHVAQAHHPVRIRRGGEAVEHGLHRPHHRQIRLQDIGRIRQHPALHGPVVRRAGLRVQKQAGHRIVRIIRETVRPFGVPRRTERQPPVVQRPLLCTAPFSEIDLPIRHVVRRPRLHIQPSVVPHQKNPDWSAIHRPIVFALQPVVIPPQPVPVQVQRRLRPKIQIPYLSPAYPAVQPRPNNQPLCLPACLGPPLRPNALKAPQHAPQEHVEPAPHVYGRHIHIGEFGGQTRRPPVRPVLRVVQRPKIPVRKPFERGARPDREIAVPTLDLLHCLLQTPADCRHPRRADLVLQPQQRLIHRPLLRKTHLKCAVPKEKVPVEIPHPLPHEQRLQMRRPCGHHQILRHPGIGPVQHPHVAVGPRLRSQPFHRIVAVPVGPPGVVPRRAEHPFGMVFPTRVLPHHHVAPAGIILPVGPAPRTQLVGHPLHEHRIPALRLRPVNIPPQHGPVAHRHRHVALDQDLIRRFGNLLCRHNTSRYSRKASSSSSSASSHPISSLTSQKPF